MKTNLLRGHRHHIKNGIFAVALLLFSGLYNLANAQTINIGPNQYAFQFTGNPNFGLFFNSTNSQYEFRNGAASPIFAIGAANGDLRSNLSFSSGSDFLVGPDRYAFRYINQPNFGLYFNDTDSRYEFLNGGANPIFGFSALDGKMTTDLQFSPSASYIVAPNNYALRSAANANIGLYFGPSDYEFRNSAGTSVLNINANTGQMVSTSSITASGGNSAQWTSAFNWGDHAAAGYISSEVDPQVGVIANNRIPRWNGSSLISGSVTDAGSGITVAGNSVFNNSLRVGGGFNGSTSSSAFTVGSATTYTALDNNEIQAYTGGSQGLLYLNFWGGDINFANNTMWLDRADARLGLNTSTPTAKLDVQGETDNTEAVINATGNYNLGNSDVRAVNADAVIAPGYGYGVDASGGYRGVYGFGNGTTYTGTTTGVYGTASGSAGTRIGVYGSASGGTTNWAMYSAGNHYVSGDLRVGFGAINGATGFKVAVDGKMICEELKVQLSQDWPDYVFADDYSMMNLNELEEYIKTENHLPGVPSASEVEEADGIMLGEMQRVTVEKLEELTLYILELKKENDQLKERIEALEN
ncbi:hypothetical protein O3Q51_02375 [Cryomorphaceae bacterium 1068]|nr:hypothetical protein [Cryomorphaceae bacterium 1068]